MNKKLIISLSVIGMVAAVAIGGTVAYFSDTETSTGNTFTTGTLDLVVVTSGDGPQGKVTVNENGDGFNDNVVFANLAPGDSGSITWTIINTGSLPGNVMIHRIMSNDVDGTNTEPETAIEGTGITASTPGELDDNMWLSSTCTINGVSTFDNPPYVGLMSLEATYGPNQFDNLPKILQPNDVLQVIYSWSIDPGVGNIIQGDTFTLDLTMTLDQIQ